MSRLVGFAMAVTALACAASGCERREPQDPSGYRQPTGYDAYGNPVYGQGPPQPTAPGHSVLGVPCQADFICGAYRCNLRTGLCASPCQTHHDCAAGFHCYGGVCLPGAPGQAPLKLDSGG